MALDPKLLEILACPEDKGPLLYFQDEDALYNPRLKRRYRVLDGDIADMLIDDAETVDDAAAILACMPREVHVVIALDWLGRGARLHLMRWLADPNAFSTHPTNPGASNPPGSQPPSNGQRRRRRRRRRSRRGGLSNHTPAGTTNSAEDAHSGNEFPRSSEPDRRN